MLLERAERTANEIIECLAPYCSRIQVAGSIRRKASNPRDIDIVLIPSDPPWDLLHEVKWLGQRKLDGTKLKRILYHGVQVDIYLATEETWATLLLIRTGSKENNIRLASLAKRKGWHLAASGDGLFNEKEERIAGGSEQSIYAALGLPFQAPWERS